MPIKNFNRCLSGDLSEVSKNKYYSPRKVLSIWPKLFNQHIEAHGLPENFNLYMAKRIKALELYSQAYSGKRWQIVKARIKDAEAKQMLSVEGESIDLMCARLSKYFKFPIRANECTVVEFYNYLASMQ